MCTLCSLSSSQSNKLKHIQKIVSWYTILYIWHSKFVIIFLMFLALYHQCQALSLHFFVSSSSSETTWQNRCSLPSEARGGQGRRSGPVAWDEQEYLTFFFYRVGVYQIYILSIHTSCLEGNITIHLKSHLSLPWLQTSHLWYRLQLFFCLMLKLNKLLLHIIWNIHDCSAM